MLAKLTLNIYITFKDFKSEQHFDTKKELLVCFETIYWKIVKLTD